MAAGYPLSISLPSLLDWQPCNWGTEHQLKGWSGLVEEASLPPWADKWVYDSILAGEAKGKVHCKLSGKFASPSPLRERKPSLSSP